MAVKKTVQKGKERLPLGRLRIPAKEIEAAVRKSETLTIRLTPADKAAMQEMAARCRVSVTEYLVSLHRLAAGKLAD